MVGAGEQIMNVQCRFYTRHLERRLAFTQRNHLDAQRMGLGRQAAANRAKPQDPQGAALEGSQCGEIPLRILYPYVRQMLGRCEDRRKGKFGDVVCRAAA